MQAVEIDYHGESWPDQGIWSFFVSFVLFVVDAFDFLF